MCSFSEIVEDFILYRLDPPILGYIQFTFFHYTGILSPTFHKKKRFMCKILSECNVVSYEYELLFSRFHHLITFLLVKI